MIVGFRTVVIRRLENIVDRRRLRHFENARESVVGEAAQLAQHDQFPVVSTECVAATVVQAPVAVDEPEMRCPVRGLQKTESLKPRNRPLEPLSRGLRRIVEVVQVQFGLAVPGGDKLLQGRHVAVYRLLSGIEPGVLPGAPGAVAMAAGDLGIVVDPAVHHGRVLARLEVVHEEEENVHRRARRLFLVEQPAHVSRQPDVVFPGHDAIGPSAQIQHEAEQKDSPDESHSIPLEHTPQTRDSVCRAHGILKGVDPVSGAANPQQIAVLGLGYVGCVTAACLAHVGHRVVGVDRDQFKVDTVRAGRAPFFEPGLEELVRDGVAAGRSDRFRLPARSPGGGRCRADLRRVRLLKRTATWAWISCGGLPRRSPNRSRAATSRWSSRYAVRCIPAPAKTWSWPRWAARRWYPWSPTRSSCAKARQLRTSWSPHCWWSAGRPRRRCDRWLRSTADCRWSLRLWRCARRR